MSGVPDFIIRVDRDITQDLACAIRDAFDARTPGGSMILPKGVTIEPFGVLGTTSELLTTERDPFPLFLAFMAGMVVTLLAVALVVLGATFA